MSRKESRVLANIENFRFFFILCFSRVLRNYLFRYIFYTRPIVEIHNLDLSLEFKIFKYHRSGNLPRTARLPVLTAAITCIVSEV